MGKKLAIKGHPTRGKEVIELLEMMGGSPAGATKGSKESYCYYISEDTATKYISWDYIGPEEIEKYKIFTLEEFLEKFPYKIGDKVYTKSNSEGTIIDMFWNGIEIFYQLSSQSVNALGHFRTNELKLYKEEANIDDNKLSDTVNNTIETISGAVSLKAIEDSIDSVQFIQSGKIVAVRFNTQNYEDEVELQLDNYKIEIRDGKTYVVRKKPKYPTTYDECCNMLDADEFVEFELMVNFPKLINARNAYWKIAGEEMGLGKPWKPDWDNLSTNHEFIKINKGDFIYSSRVLVFPSKEMRDAFYENFKDLIGQCKELL